VFHLFLVLCGLREPQQENDNHENGDKMERVGRNGVQSGLREPQQENDNHENGDKIERFERKEVHRTSTTLRLPVSLSMHVSNNGVYITSTKIFQKGNSYNLQRVKIF